MPHLLLAAAAHHRHQPVPEDAEDEDEQFFVIDKQGEAAPPSLKCPNTIQEMMIIVQEMRLQRAEHMNNFTYNARVIERDLMVTDQEDDEEEVVVTKRRRKCNYDLMAAISEEDRLKKN
mmetsp:Transcript_12967/g.17669  ORF Transcript_12967/g.17669 Transcript_12967/m.17669 type:complete len:119 (-) Transcript_12967:74-430(-)